VGWGSYCIIRVLNGENSKMVGILRRTIQKRRKIETNSKMGEDLRKNAKKEQQLATTVH